MGYYNLLFMTSGGVRNHGTLMQNSSIDFANETNGASASNDSHIYGPDAEDRAFVHYIFDVVGILITIATLVGNVLIVVAVVCEKRLRKVGNVFIINLALSDCLVGAFVSPLAIVYDVTGKWLLGEFMCDLWISMDVICCTASILNLCAISYDRCNAIVEPIKYSRKRTFSRAWLVVTFVWIYSVIIALPPFIGWRKPNEIGLPNGRCQISKHLGYTLFSTIGAFFLPLCVMLYFYLKLYKATCIRKEQWRHSPGSSHFVGHNMRNVRSGRFSLCCFNCCKNVRQSPECTDMKVESLDIAEIAAPESELKTQKSIDTDTIDESRRESIEPELLAIYQIRDRSTRNLSNVTESSFSSMFLSSTDSSGATTSTSFSESSDRSLSISTEGSARGCSISTEGGRSFSAEGGRRYSAMRAHRLSGARQSSLQTEVIHELVSAQTEVSSEEAKKGSPPSKSIGPSDTDDANDEESDEPTTKTKPKRKLKSSTFRHRNSRKRKKIALSQEKRAAKTLGIVMGCFILCWSPFFIVAILSPFCRKCFFHPLLLKAVSWLGYFNSTCNPIIYTFFNKDFRSAFKNMTCSKSEEIVYV